MPELMKLTQAILPLGSTSIDCYLTPEGDRRIGLSGASSTINQLDTYLEDLLLVNDPTLKSLYDFGFTGVIQEGVIGVNPVGVVKTISTPDFCRVLLWDALTHDTTSSIALLAAFAEVGLERILA